MSLDTAIDRVEELLAVHLLEYHNKNWLNMDPKDLALEKQAALRGLRGLLQVLKEDAISGPGAVPAESVTLHAGNVQIPSPDPSEPVLPLTVRFTGEEARDVFSECEAWDAMCDSVEISTNSGAVTTLLQALALLALVSRGSVVNLSGPREGLCTRFTAGGFFHLKASMTKNVNDEERPYGLVSSGSATEIRIELDKVVVTAQMYYVKDAAENGQRQPRTARLTLSNSDVMGLHEALQQRGGS